MNGAISFRVLALHTHLELVSLHPWLRVSCMHVALGMYEGDPKKQNLFIKYCVFILTSLNFSHLQSTLHFIQYTHRDIFTTAQNSVELVAFNAL